MRIGIDARMMSPDATRGIGRYTEELIRALLQAAPEHRYVLVTRRTVHPFMSHPSVETVVEDIPWYGVEEQVRMPSVLRSLHADVVHIPHWNVPLAYTGPLIITVHDLLLRHTPLSARVSLRHPAIAFVKRMGYRVTLWNALRRASVVLAPTNFTETDIVHFYPWTKGKVCVTGEGMLHGYALSPTRRPEAPTSAPHPPEEYLLYVGSAYPHKGLDLLLDVWATLEQEHSRLHLKIVGKEDEFMRRVKDRVRAEGMHRVEFLGYVDEEGLYPLYRDALAFVFPSQFEGFGLPPLEAIHAGCPVVSSDASALPEVLGDAAVFFRHDSKNAMLHAIESVVRDPRGARQRAVEALPMLEERHSWQRAAAKTLEAYRSL